MVLKLNGKPLELNPLAPTEQRVIEVLKKAPADEVFDNVELAHRVGVDRRYLQDKGFASSPAAQPYTLLVRQRRYWGNPVAIKALRKQASG